MAMGESTRGMAGTAAAGPLFARVVDIVTGSIRGIAGIVKECLEQLLVLVLLLAIAITNRVV
jgi:hypothetical protein